MLFSSWCLLGLACITSAMPALVTRDVDAVIDSLSAEASSWTTINSFIDQFSANPSADFGEAIISGLAEANRLIQQTTEDAESSGFFGDVGGQEVVTNFEILQQRIVPALQNLGDQRGKVAALSPNIGIDILSELEAIRSSSEFRTEVFDDRLPEDLRDDFDTSAATIDVELAIVIGIYSGP